MRWSARQAVSFASLMAGASCVGGIGGWERERGGRERGGSRSRRDQERIHTIFVRRENKKKKRRKEEKKQNEQWLHHHHHHNDNSNNVPLAGASWSPRGRHQQLVHS